MKPNGVLHPKVQMLATELNIRHWGALGLSEHLQHLTARTAPQGDIGKWPDSFIAHELDWPVEDAKRLIQALIKTRKLDRHPQFRLVLHDWHEHCEQSVHIHLARHGLLFASGHAPSMTKLTNKEREEILKKYPGAQKAHSVRSRAREGATRSPKKRPSSPSPESTPSPSPAPLPTSESTPKPKTHAGNAHAGNGRRKRSSADEHLTDDRELKPTAPESIGKGIDAALQAVRARLIQQTPAAMTARILRSTRDKPKAGQWWRLVVDKLDETPGGIEYLDMMLDYIERCADPKKRKLEDLGELRQPAAYLTSRILSWSRKHKVKLPDREKVNAK